MNTQTAGKENENHSRNESKALYSWEAVEKFQSNIYENIAFWLDTEAKLLDREAIIKALFAMCEAKNTDKLAC